MRVTSLDRRNNTGLQSKIQQTKSSIDFQNEATRKIIKNSAIGSYHSVRNYKEGSGRFKINLEAVMETQNRDLIDPKEIYLTNANREETVNY